jgi:predicted RNase H-like nuclease (RuvC/YqgF family)
MMANELERKIAETEQALREVKQEIKDLKKVLHADVFTPDQHDPSVEKVQSKIERLETEKVALQNKEVELLREKNIHLEQQQQSGAGRSMLPMH